MTAKVQLAGFVEPMLATRVRELPSGPAWEYEVKWDGYRIIAVKNGDQVKLFSRRRANYNNRFRAVTKAVASVHAKSAVLDGEVVAVDSLGRPSFQVLQHQGKLPAGYHLVYYVFDLVWLNGKDLKSLVLSVRRRALEEIVAGTRVLFSGSLGGDVSAILTVIQENNLEGVVAKRVDSKYEAGRRGLSWLKLPLKPKQEFVIGGYRPDGNGLELILVGYYEEGKLLFAGKVHQGLNPANRRRLLRVLKPLAIGSCPFANLPNARKGHWGEGVTAEEMQDFVWVKPEIAADIKFTEWTSGGVLRHAELVGT